LQQSLFNQWSTAEQEDVDIRISNNDSKYWNLKKIIGNHRRVSKLPDFLDTSNKVPGFLDKSNKNTSTYTETLIS